MLEAGPSVLRTNSRLGLQLSTEEASELADRLRALAAEYAQRPPTTGGKRVGLFLARHELA